MLTPQIWLIGADPRCDLVVDQPTVSAQHCRLTRTDKGYLLEDLQSTNGTFVGDRRIDTPTPVTEDDTITLGRSVPMPWPDEAPPRRAVVETEPVPAPSHSDRATGAEADRILRIGRQPDNDIVLDYPIVSGHHARVVFVQGQPWIEDCGSRNGTAIGARSNQIQRARLSADDVVYFGTLRVPAARLLAGNLILGSQPYTALKMAGEETVIGRAKICDIVLNDPRVSRRHARLISKGESVAIEDLGSSMGTFVNGGRITGRQSLRAGDLVAIGRFTLKLTAEGDLEQRDYRGNVAIEARGVAVDVPGCRLLEGVSLTIYPSELVGLMGPSGAGKTTLMNALNGYTPPAAGQVLFNDGDLYAHYAEYQGMIGYVPQDDIMHRELTVAEALYYTARLRLPADTSDAEIYQRVAEVIGQLGLQGTEKVLIGSAEKKGISGGQRKRVNLAMELMTDPSVLFLDEPTSGLSSEDALMVMRLLRNLADGGKTIIVAIHQPSLEAYRLLDNLILVAKDPKAAEPGRLAYYGPAYPQAVDFFNPGGVEGLKPGREPSPGEVLRGLARDLTAAWVARYQASPLKRQFVDARKKRKGLVGRNGPKGGSHQAGPSRSPAGLGQWQTLVRRCLAVKLRDTANTAILLDQAPVIALLMVLVFGKQTTEEVTADNWYAVAGATSTTVFLLALAALWFGCSNAAREIVAEWAVYRRERMVNLKIPSYVGSKFTVLGGLCLLQCAVLLGVVHLGAGLKGPWPAMFGILLLTSLVGLGVGLTVSSLARTSEVAVALLPLILLPMVILAGVLQPVHEMGSPTKLLAHAMPSRWAFEGLLLLESEERPTWTPPAATDPETPDEGAPAEPEPPQQRDMAERYFPAGDTRTSPRAAGIVLTAMLLLLTAAIHTIFTARDIH